MVDSKEIVEEFFSKEKNIEFQVVRKKLAEDIFGGKLEPMDAFRSLALEVKRVYPKVWDSPLVDNLYDKTQLYLTMWILSRLGKLFKK